MSIEFGLLILGAYLLGSVPAAYLAAKLSRGVDIRQYGSGNMGATNLLELTSKRVVIPVIIFDLSKGMVAIYVAQQIGLGITQQVILGMAAIVGHNWSVFLRFSGGRGVLTAVGVAIILPIINNVVPPWSIIVLGAIVAISFTITHHTPVGVCAGMAALPLASWGFGEPLPLTLGYLAIFLLLLIRRLAVPQPVGAAPMNKKKLLLNRFLFDRDIRDREAWIYRALEQRERQGKE